MAVVLHQIDNARPTQLEFPFIIPPQPIAPKEPASNGLKQYCKLMPLDYQLPLFSFHELRQALLLSEFNRAKRLAQSDTSPYVHFLFFLVILFVLREVCIENDTNKPVKFVPRRLHAFLDRHFPSFVVKREELFDLSVKLAKMEKTRVGDVVKMSHSELSELLEGDDGKLQSLLEALGEVGLELDMKTPGWKSPGGIFHSRW